jgi:hypothetical protein
MFSNCQNTLKWIWWRNMWSSSNSIYTTQGIPWHRDGLNNHVVRHITPCHKRLKGSNMNQVAFSYYIQLNKMEKTNVEGVVGHIKNKIVSTHLKPSPPTIILTNHLPILTHMDMMWIIVSHYMANHKPQMLRRARDLGKFKKGKVQPTRDQHQASLN